MNETTGMVVTFSPATHCCSKAGAGLVALTWLKSGCGFFLGKDSREKRRFTGLCKGMVSMLGHSIYTAQGGKCGYEEGDR